MSHPAVEILVSIAASAIMVLMVAGGGVAVERMNPASAASGPATCESDPLTSCRIVRGQTICVREPS